MRAKSTFQLFSAVRIALGCLLLTAAGLKAHGLTIDAVSQDSFLSSPRLLVATIEIEIVLGFWLLSGWSTRAARIAAIAFFTVLASTSLYLALEGQTSCGCFGRVSVSPWISLTVNVAAILGLVFFHPSVLPSEYGSQWIKGMLRTGAGALCFLTLIAGTFLLVSNDPRATLARLRGEPLTVEPSQSWLGEGIADEQRAFTIQLMNRGDQPVQIVGGTANCACIATADVPISVPAGDSRPLTVKVFFRGQPGLFQGSFILFTDDKSQPVLKARFGGRVIESPSP